MAGRAPFLEVKRNRPDREPLPPMLGFRCGAPQPITLNDPGIGITRTHGVSNETTPPGRDVATVPNP